jgi:hypothetical protein
VLNESHKYQRRSVEIRIVAGPASAVQWAFNGGPYTLNRNSQIQLHLSIP